MTRASGVGSWPGSDNRDHREATRAIRDLLTVTPSGSERPGIPYLPELPGRGPGADMLGRAAGLLVELPVDLQPSGWRFVDRAGADAARIASWWRADLDEFAEAYDGYVGLLKVQVCGPWTLGAGVRLLRGERAIVDPGARRDLVASLAEGVARHVDDVRRLVPGAEVVVQIDEPGLPAVLAGELPTSSGFGRIRAVDQEEARRGLADVLSAATRAGAVETLVHCCAPGVPFALLRATGAGGVAVDISLLGPAGWESVAAGVEDGLRLWAGCLPTGVPDARRRLSYRDIAEPLLNRWRELGLARELLSEVVLTPACGLAGSDPVTARNVHRVVIDAAGAVESVARE